VVGRLHVGCGWRPECRVAVVVFLLAAVEGECCVIDDETDNNEGYGEEPVDLDC
jgi:hypothetical protein